MPPGMTSRMRKHSGKNKVWRIIRAIVAGVLITIGLSYLAASSQSLNSYTHDSQKDLPINPSGAPSYLGELTPPFESAYLTTPFGKSIRSWYYKHLPDFGTDHIEYIYSEPDAPSRWSPMSTEDTPEWMTIVRHRFGWPMRAMFWDSVGWSPGGGREYVLPFAKKINSRAGLNDGFATPRWWPTSDQNYRMPIKILWGGFLVNVMLFAALWIVPGFVWRTGRTQRRRRRGLCVECGYAVEDLGACPECGSANSRGVAA